MNGVRQRLLGLCLPPILMCALDCTLTLAGQSANYWAGNYSDVNEASPTLNHLLQIHPAMLVVGVAIWICVFAAVILLLPDVLALIVAIGVTLAHTAGAASWVMWRFKFGYQAANLLFLICAIALGIGIRYGWRAAPAEAYSLGRISMAQRWVMALLLSALAVYLFLWPRQP
jgi:hypothetical protein